MPSFPWRPTFFGTPATEDRPFHAIVEYHRYPPNASIISCFDKKSIEIGSNKPISPCSSMYASMIRSKITHPPAKIPQLIQPQPGGCVRGVLGQRLHHGDELDGPWPGQDIAAAARKRRCIRHRSPAPAKGRRPAGRCGKQPRRPNHRHHPRGPDRPKSGYRLPPPRSGPASQGLNGPAVPLATGDRTQRRPMSSGTAKRRAVASSGHPPLFLCPHCTKKYRSCPSKTSTDASAICPQSVHFYGQDHARREKASLRVVQLFYRKISPASSSSSRRRTRTKSGDRSGR